ncbi:MAG: restriction endonuclease subunit S [Bacteroidaceae bacterium]|nr:restriction endonuclease subunit S [Bacteroidaceae bacterium]
MNTTFNISRPKRHVISARKKPRNHNLEDQAKALYKSWFVDFEPFKDEKFVNTEIGVIPEGWDVQPLRTILQYSKKSINPQKYPETIFTHYSLPAYDNSKEPEVQKGHEIMSNKFVIENNMILFSKLNPRIKRIWYIDNIPFNSICSTEFIAYKALDRNSYPYCWCYLNSDMFYDKIMSSVNGATGSHQRFHAEETLDICIPYNRTAIQSFSALIKPMLESVIKNEAEIRVLKNERDLLLPHLMNGKMTINN